MKASFWKVVAVAVFEHCLVGGLGVKDCLGDDEDEDGEDGLLHFSGGWRAVINSGLTFKVFLFLPIGNLSKTT